MNEETARKHLAELNALILATPIDLNTPLARAVLDDKAEYKVSISQNDWNDKT